MNKYINSLYHNILNKKVYKKGGNMSLGILPQNNSNKIEQDKLLITTDANFGNSDFFNTIEINCISCKKHEKIKVPLKYSYEWPFLAPPPFYISYALKTKQLPFNPSNISPIISLCETCLENLPENLFFTEKDKQDILDRRKENRINFDNRLVVSQEEYSQARLMESIDAQTEFVKQKIIEYYYSELPDRISLYEELVSTNPAKKNLKSFNRHYDKLSSLKKNKEQDEHIIATEVEIIARLISKRYHKKDVWSKDIKDEMSKMEAIYKRYEKKKKTITIPILLKGLIINGKEVCGYYPIIFEKIFVLKDLSVNERKKMIVKLIPKIKKYIK